MSRLNPKAFLFPGEGGVGSHTMKFQGLLYNLKEMEPVKFPKTQQSLFSLAFIFLTTLFAKPYESEDSISKS